MFDSHDVACSRLVVKVQFGAARLQLTQDTFDASFDGRVVCAVASHKLLNDCSKGCRYERRVGDKHLISLLFRRVFCVLLVRAAGQVFRVAVDLERPMGSCLDNQVRMRVGQLIAHALARMAAQMIEWVAVAS